MLTVQYVHHTPSVLDGFYTIWMDLLHSLHYWTHAVSQTQCLPELMTDIIFESFSPASVAVNVKAVH